MIDNTPYGRVREDAAVTRRSDTMTSAQQTVIFPKHVDITIPTWKKIFW